MASKYHARSSLDLRDNDGRYLKVDTTDETAFITVPFVGSTFDIDQTEALANFLKGWVNDARAIQREDAQETEQEAYDAECIRHAFL